MKVKLFAVSYKQTKRFIGFRNFFGNAQFKRGERFFHRRFCRVNLFLIGCDIFKNSTRQSNSLYVHVVTFGGVIALFGQRVFQNGLQRRFVRNKVFRRKSVLRKLFLCRIVRCQFVEVKETEALRSVVVKHYFQRFARMLRKVGNVSRQVAGKLRFSYLVPVPVSDVLKLGIAP